MLLFCRAVEVIFEGCSGAAEDIERHDAFDEEPSLLSVTRIDNAKWMKKPTYRR